MHLLRTLSTPIMPHFVTSLCGIPDILHASPVRRLPHGIEAIVVWLELRLAVVPALLQDTSFRASLLSVALQAASAVW